MPGLGNNLRVCKNNFVDKGASDGAVFGLLEPEPASRTENTEFPAAWIYLMGSVGRLLLTYEPTEEIISRSFVIDWAHMERLHGGHKDDLDYDNSAVIDNVPTREQRRAAERSYWASRVPLADYIAHPEAISKIALPEVITMYPVPAEIIRIADTQPLLLDLVPYEKRTVLRAIEQSPELEILRAYAA